MGAELGLSPEEMKPQGQQPAVQAACGAASAKLQSEMQGLRADAKLKIDVKREAPRCEVDMNAYAKCAGECDASVAPASSSSSVRAGDRRRVQGHL